jgi:hypothetical protein
LVFGPAWPSTPCEQPKSLWKFLTHWNVSGPKFPSMDSGVPASVIHGSPADDD